jgi:MFS family permease
MSGLALFFHAQEISHSIASAGFAVGAYSLISSFTAAIRGHAIDRWGQTTPLALLVPGYAFACFLLAFVAKDPTTTIVLAGVMGLFAPPINMSIRPLWKQLVADDQIRTAYALDTVLLNITSLLGPVIGTWCALTFSGPVAMNVTGILMLIGGIALLTSKISREWIPEERVPGEAGLFASPAMRLLALEGALVGLGYGLLDVAVPSAATLNDMAVWAAPSLAAVALGGIVGGIAAGSRFKSVLPGRGVYLTGYMFAAFTVPLFLIPPGPFTVLVLLLMGLPIGAAQVYYLEVVDMVRPRGMAVAAMGTVWLIEGSAAAGGNAIAGFISEHYSPTLAMLCIGPLLLAAALLLQIGSRGPLKAAMQPYEESELT